MKKLVFSLVALLLIGCSANAQNNNIDYFLKNFNWNSNEQEILNKYHGLIIRRPHSFDKKKLSYSDWYIKKIQIGKLNYDLSFFIDSISKKISYLYLNLSNQEKTENKDKIKTLVNDIEDTLSATFGKPDYIDNDESDFINSYIRKWYNKTLLVEMVFFSCNDTQGCSIDIYPMKDTGFDFRKFKWGDSKEKIISIEKKPNLITGVNQLYMFNDNIASMNCQVAFIFTNNKLSMGKYIFSPVHTNENNCIEDYDRIVALLSEKYGIPESNTSKWNNSLYINDKEKYGFAVSLGYLTYNAEWETEITDIKTALYGENYKTTLLIQYKSKKYEQQQDQIQKKKESEQF